MFTSRASTWPRDHLCRSTIAPRRSKPTTWNAFLPMSMPIVVISIFDLSDIAVLLYLDVPSKHHSLEGREHGRTIPLAAPPCSSSERVSRVEGDHPSPWCCCRLRADIYLTCRADP